MIIYFAVSSFVFTWGYPSLFNSFPIFLFIFRFPRLFPFLFSYVTLALIIFVESKYFPTLYITLVLMERGIFYVYTHHTDSVIFHPEKYILRFFVRICLMGVTFSSVSFTVFTFSIQFHFRQAREIKETKTKFKINISKKKIQIMWNKLIDLWR